MNSQAAANNIPLFRLTCHKNLEDPLNAFRPEAVRFICRLNQPIKDLTIIRRSLFKWQKNTTLQKKPPLTRTPLSFPSPSPSVAPFNAAFLCYKQQK